jgi:2',3'-cyclic-nucleotide 2'-phosphodiesterase (5'-nucleotidase family)
MTLSNNATQPSPRRREALLSLAAFLLVVILGFALMLALNPVGWRTMMASPPFSASPPLALTILHTNDTWGYTAPCG